MPLASFSLRNSDVLNILRCLEPYQAESEKKIFFRKLSLSRKSSEVTKAHTWLDSGWPCRKSKFVSRGWWVIIWYTSWYHASFFKQLFYLSNLKTSWFRKQTHVLATDSSCIAKVTDFASRGRKLIMIIELEHYMMYVYMSIF